MEIKASTSSEINWVKNNSLNALKNGKTGKWQKINKYWKLSKKRPAWVRLFKSEEAYKIFLCGQIFDINKTNYQICFR